MLNQSSSKALVAWKPVSERIVCARFYSKYSKLIVIQCYSPTNTADEADKHNFYEQLQSEVAKTPKHDVLMVIGDLKVGSDNTGREDHMGKHGTGDMNENGELFADFCGLNGLVIGAPSSLIKRSIRPHGTHQTKELKIKLTTSQSTANGERLSWIQGC